MSSLNVRLLRENCNGFSEFKRSLRDLQDDNYQCGEPGNLVYSEHTEEDSGAKGSELLSIFAVRELQQFCATSPSQRNSVMLERCAELCAPLGFFRRLTLSQRAAIFRAAALIHVPAGAYIERIGDPCGFVYVVILGNVALEQECHDIGNRIVFVHTYTDGKAFGDGWDASHADDGFR